MTTTSIFHPSREGNYPSLFWLRNSSTKNFTLAAALHQAEMLPGNFPKLGGFFINLAAKFSRIELKIQVHEPCFGIQRKVLVFKESLAERPGCIIPFDGSIANAFLGNQFG